MASILNPYRKYILQSILAFVAGSQFVHYYLNPLKDIDDFVASKKSELWESYLKEKEWIPMESNPEVMNAFLRRVGVKSHINVVDILGFDDELLQMVEGKVEGVLLCYPLKGQTDDTVDEDAKERLYFMRQTIRNACATMALIHLLANKCQDDDFEPDSAIKEFIKESKQLEPEKKANKFETCETIATAHERSSVEGQTEAPAATEAVEYHFISLIDDNNTIYEMDGRKHGPISHGPTTPQTFLKDAIEVVKKFVNIDPSNPNFSMQAITRKPRET